MTSHGVCPMLRAAIALATTLVFAGPALAQSDQQKRDRNPSIQNGIDRVKPAQPPQAGSGGRNIQDFKGYQGKPHDYNRPYNVPSPSVGTGRTTPGSSASGGSGGSSSVNRSTSTYSGGSSSTGSSSSGGGSSGSSRSGGSSSSNSSSNTKK